MADNNMNQSSTPNENKKDESMKREQGQPMTGERKPEQSELDKSKQEKSAIGGGERQQSQGGQNPSGQQSGQSPAGQDQAFDKNKSEPASR